MTGLQYLGFLLRRPLCIMVASQSKLLSEPGKRVFGFLMLNMPEELFWDCVDLHFGCTSNWFLATSNKNIQNYDFNEG